MGVPYETVNPEPRRPVSLSVRHLMFLVLVAAFALSVVVQNWQAALLFCLPILPIGGVVLLVTWLFRRRTVHQRGLLSVLSIAAERRLPLSAGTNALAGLSSGGFRRKARILSHILESGRPLPEALYRLPGLLPPGATALACLGWSEDALAAGLKEAQAAEATRRLYESEFLSKLFYLTGLLLGFQVVAGFMLYWIVPKFEAILNDYGMPLPQLTLVAIRATRYATFSGVFPLLFLFEIVALGYLVLINLGFLHGRPPGVNWIFRRRDAAAVLRGLAVTVDAERPITEGLKHLANFHAVSGIRRRLRYTIAYVEHGQPWTGALRRARLIGSNDAALLDAAQRAGNLSWALRSLAEGYERRLGFRLHLLVQLLAPLVVLFAGAFVAIAVIGYFLPLVYLIEKLG